jgi:uncharacterized delta-60 repeat protein
VLVDWYLADLTGTNGVDYFGPTVDGPGTLVFDDYQLSADFLVEVASDLMPTNGDKQVQLVLTNPRPDPEEDSFNPGLFVPTLGFTALSTLNILELDKGGSQTNFNIARRRYAVNEDLRNGPLDTNGLKLTTITVDVLMEGGGPGQVQYELHTGNRVTGATLYALSAGSDYPDQGMNTWNNPPYTDGSPNIINFPDWAPTNSIILNFGAGQSRISVVNVLIPDNTVEFNEDIQVLLVRVPNQPGLGANPEARITILNDDQPAGALDRSWNPDLVEFTTPRFNAAPGANGNVLGMAIQNGSNTVIVGEFTSYNSFPCGRIARINPDGSFDDTFASGTGADSFITSVAMDSTGGINGGKIVVGGGFTSFNNIQRNGVARLQVDGSLDPTFTVGSGANGVVRCVAVQSDGKVVIGGDFSQFNGVARNRIARLNTDGSLDLGFDPGQGPDDSVLAVTAIDVGLGVQKIFIAGDFLEFSGAFRGGVARLNGNGLLDTSYDPGGGADGPVYALAVQPDGRLLLGGGFTSVDFRDRHGVARLDPTGALDTTFDPGTGADDAVYAVTLQADGKPIIGGIFSSFNGTRRLGITRLFVNGTVDTSFMDTAYNQYAGLITTMYAESPSYINAIALESSGDVMIGGSFSQLGGTKAPILNRPREAFITVWDLAYTRQEKRVRTNVARLIGGYTPGPGNLGFTLAQNNVSENAGLYRVPLRRTDGRLGAVTVEASTSDILATAGVDYDASAGIALWIQGRYVGVPPESVGDVDERFFNVPIHEDTLVEGDELFGMHLEFPFGVIRLGGLPIPLGAALARRDVVATLVDDDFNTGILNFSSAIYSTNEGAGSIRITVIRTNGSSGPASVRYFTQNGTATAPQDFTAVNLATLNFASGETTKTITIPLFNDSLVEPDEIFTVTLTNATGARLPGGTVTNTVTATAVIIDDDLLTGRATFAAATFATNENAGTAQIVLLREGGSLGELTVTVEASPGTADASDFTPVTNLVTWVDGDVAPKIFPVALLDDLNVEGNETVTLRITNPATPLGIGMISNAVLTIQDDDFSGALSFSQAIYDADERGTNVTIIVTRTGGSGGTVTVDYTAVNGTAKTNVDFSLPAGSHTLTFPPGLTATNFDITIIDNPTNNPDRSATLMLVNRTGGATAGTYQSATLRIIDDESIGDPAGSLDTAFSPVAGGTNAIHSVVVQPDGKLLVGGEFRTLNRVLRSRVGRLYDDGTLDPTFDPKQGPNAAVRAIALQPDGRMIIGGFFNVVASTNRNHIARLLADGTLDRFFDPGAGADNPVYALALDPSGRVFIGGSFVTVNGIFRSGVAALEANGTVSPSFNTGGGINGSVFALALQVDGKLVVGGDFTTFDGLSHPYLVRLNSDGTADATFNPGAGPDGPVRAITLQADGRILIGGSFTNVDGVSRGRLARLSSTGALDTTFLTSVEGANGDVESMALQFDGKLVVVGAFTSFNGASRNRITRLYRNGKTDPTINFGTGANDEVGTVAIQTDRKIVIGGRFMTYDNQPRNFLARIFGGSIAGPGSVEFSQPVYAIGENTGNAVISVRRRGGTTSDITVDYYSGVGTATPGTDYTPVASTLTFLEGETEQTFSVPLVNDFVGEPNETVPLFLTNQTAGVTLGAVPRSTLIIVNDDSGVGFSSAGYTVNENAVGGGVVITVLRTGATNGTATVDYRTANGTARSPQDYLAQSGTITFLPGQTSHNLVIPIVDDTVIESDETFLVLLTNLVGSTALSVPAATVTIRDNDFRTGNLIFSATSYSVLESAGSVVITVLRTNGTTGAVTVDYRTVSGTALSGNDFVAQSGTLVFNEGQSVGVITIPILDDSLVEGDEDFQVILSNPGGGALILGATNAVVTILDEEFGPGSVDRGFNPGSGANRPVRVVGMQPSGKVLIGGAFNTFNGTNRLHIARLNADGSLDLAFDPGVGVDAVVSGVASGPVGKVLAGGAFTNAGGVAYNRLVQFNDDGSPDSTFNHDTTLNAAVGTLVVQTNGRVLLGGSFSQPSRGITRVFANGLLDASFDVGTGVEGAVNGIAVAPDGSVVVGGSFTNVGGDLHLSLVVFTSLGLVDTSFTNGAIATGAVSSVAVQADGRIIAVGDFLTAGSSNRTRIARFNRDGSLDPSFNVGLGADALVYAVGLQSSGQAVVAGDFTTIDGIGRNRFARLNVDGSLDLSFDPGRGADGTVFSLVVLPDDDIMIAGGFNQVGGLVRPGVARIQGTDAGAAAVGFGGVSVQGGLLRLRTRVALNQKSVLEVSDDLRQWRSVATNNAGNLMFTVPVDPEVPGRFFRVKGINP